MNAVYYHESIQTVRKLLIRTQVQPCDWSRSPALLQQQLYQLPEGAFAEEQLPYPCQAGFVGGTTIAEQGSINCAGKCPAGFLCPFTPTLTPQPCVAGSYCPEGSLLPLPCPEGTFSSATNLTSAALCTVCPLGHACAVGATAPSECSPGTYSDVLRRATCIPVPAGFYQAAYAAFNYLICELGSYCPEAASAPLPCPAGTYGSATDLASAEQCTVCPAGASLIFAKIVVVIK